MGFAKQHMEDVQDRGWDDTGEALCLDHILEPFLTDAAGPATATECSFCGRSDPEGDAFAVELDTVMEAFMPALWQFYGRYDESPVFDGETIDTEDTDIAVADVGSDVFALDVEDDILAAVTTAIVDTEVSTWDSRMDTEDLAFKWEQFEKVTRFGSRFIATGRPLERSPLAEVMPFLDELVDYVDGEHNLVTTIKTDEGLYRGRLLRNQDDLFTKPSDLGAPPAEMAQAGRMSPAGIRMFYGADDVETAVAEIAVHGVHEFAQIALWHPTRELTILDLTKNPANMPSAFDPTKWDTIRRLRFLRHFASSIARPIVPDGRQHNEYAPTQVLTEYFRFVPRTKLDGIAYPSAHTGGRNIALFIEPPELGRPAEELPLRADEARMRDLYRVTRRVTATRVE